MLSGLSPIQSSEFSYMNVHQDVVFTCNHRDKSNIVLLKFCQGYRTEPPFKLRLKESMHCKNWGIRFNTISVKFNTFVVSIYVHTIGC